MRPPKPDYTEEEQLIHEALMDARKLHEFLMGDMIDHKEFSIDYWIPVFEKRVDKIKIIDPSNPMAKVELRKRILQQAILSIKALKLLESGVKLTK